MMVEQVRVWNDPHRVGVDSRIEVCPKRTPDSAVPRGRVIDKRCACVALSWPTKEPSPVVISLEKCTIRHALRTTHLKEN
jgi:hypothetical protein